ncbi:MAG: putative manganese transporter [Lachnospiraceae bacterium]
MHEIMEHIFAHAIEDNLKIIPFLFITYCIMEWIEHTVGESTQKFVKHAGKYGPLFGSVAGIFPQCGFSAAASGFYSGGVITLGTLLAIFLSTSDEMLPILISESIPAGVIIKILITKVIIGMTAGFMVDFVLKRIGKGHVVQKHIHDLCEHDHCHCEENGHSVWKSALIHTIKVEIFIIIVSVALNAVMEFGGEEILSSMAFSNPVLGSLIAGAVGIIPNCAASVIITQLYLKGVMSAGAMMAGLLVGAGVGVLVLFKTNHPLKQNIKILAILYGIGVFAGMMTDLIGLTF